MPMILPVLFTDAVKKKYGQDTEIQLTYEDQHFNDFKSLFFGLHGKNRGIVRGLSGNMIVVINTY